MPKPVTARPRTLWRPHCGAQRRGSGAAPRSARLLGTALLLVAARLAVAQAHENVAGVHELRFGPGFARMLIPAWVGEAAVVGVGSARVPSTGNTLLSARLEVGGDTGAVLLQALHRRARAEAGAVDYDRCRPELGWCVTSGVIGGRDWYRRTQVRHDTAATFTFEWDRADRPRFEGAVTLMSRSFVLASGGESLASVPPPDSSQAGENARTIAPALQPAPASSAVVAEGGSRSVASPGTDPEQSSAPFVGPVMMTPDEVLLYEAQVRGGVTPERAVAQLPQLLEAACTRRSSPGKSRPAECARADLYQARIRAVGGRDLTMTDVLVPGTSPGSTDGRSVGARRAPTILLLGCSLGVLLAGGVLAVRRRRHRSAPQRDNAEVAAEIGQRRPPQVAVDRSSRATATPTRVFASPFRVVIGAGVLVGLVGIAGAVVGRQRPASSRRDGPYPVGSFVGSGTSTDSGNTLEERVGLTVSGPRAYLKTSAKFSQGSHVLTIEHDCTAMVNQVGGVQLVSPMDCTVSSPAAGRSWQKRIEHNVHYNQYDDSWELLDPPMAIRLASASASAVAAVVDTARRAPLAQPSPERSDFRSPRERMIDRVQALAAAGRITLEQEIQLENAIRMGLYDRRGGGSDDAEQGGAAQLPP